MSSSLKSLCVFCGSSMGARDEYKIAAQTFGHLLAVGDITLVYGGGRVGLMGALADAALTSGGRVIGVIPKNLFDKEIAHTSLTDLHVVSSMSERKNQMGNLSDAFVALPGGVGTLDELFEVWTWTLLGLQRKPCGILNVRGYFDPLLAFLDRAVDEDFLRPQSRASLIVDDDAPRLLDRLAASIVSSEKNA